MIARVVFCCLLLLSGHGSEIDLLDLSLGEPANDLSVERALTWLRQQQQESGQFGGDRNGAAQTALVLWAHAAAGITVDDPEHGPALRKALFFLLEQQNKDGYFGEKDGSRMYGHALVTLSLALAFGCHDEDRLNERLVTSLRASVTLIESAARVHKAADLRGGWRYTPTENRSDVSVSVWQAQALEAVAQCGLPVSEAVVDEAGAFFLRMCSEDGRVGYERIGEDRASLRGSMLLALAACGEAEAAKATQVLQRLMAEEPGWQGPWFFMRSSASALALCRYQPDGWRLHVRALQTILREQQHKEGWWPKPPGDNEGEHGRIYSCSLAVIALCADRFHLAPYQP